MIFEAMIISEPTEEQAEKGELEEIVLMPVVIVAKDHDSAKVEAVARAIELYPTKDRRRWKVLMRPFCK